MKLTVKKTISFIFPLKARGRLLIFIKSACPTAVSGKGYGLVQLFKLRGEVA